MASYITQRLNQIFILIIPFISYTLGCYTSIINFGDSISDTGNIAAVAKRSGRNPHFASPPYGETYFHHPTGRCSDGRLIVDFIAQALGLPLVAPYVGDGPKDLEKGANLAFAGATALNSSFLQDKGIYTIYPNISLRAQLNLFKTFLPRVCSTSSECKEYLGNSLILMGEIGGNDYNYGLFLRKNLGEIQELVPLVVDEIAAGIQLLSMLVAQPRATHLKAAFHVLRYLKHTIDKGLLYSPRNSLSLSGYSDADWVHARAEYHSLALKTKELLWTSFVIRELLVDVLIDMGAKTLLVPGNFPIGCIPAFLASFQSSEKEQYDPSTGCLKWLNEFSEYHNKHLQAKLDQLRELYPDAKILYADYYNSALRLYESPKQFGFYGDVLNACCGGGGPYNYNNSTSCGNPSATACDDPSTFISWDGIHFTEAGYRSIFQNLFDEGLTNPRFDSICTSVSSMAEKSLRLGVVASKLSYIVHKLFASVFVG